MTCRCSRFTLSFRSLSTLALEVQQTPQTHLFECNKSIKELSKLGRVDEARQVFDEMSQRDAVSWNFMIYGYTHNGRLYEARSLFNVFSRKNVKTWTTMLTGYARSGLLAEAKTVFDTMPKRNVVAWNAMISGCVQNGKLNRARKLFDEMPEKDIASWNSIISGYTHRCLMKKARHLFDQMAERDSMTWMPMISGYVNVRDFEKAWDVFLMMHRSRSVSEKSILLVILSAVTGLNDLELIQNFRTLTIKMGYEEDVVVGTAILNAYTRIGCLNSAYEFFKVMPVRNEYTLGTMIAALALCGRLDDAIELYEKAPEQTVVMQSTMMTAYFQKGKVQEARATFDEITNPNIITWNAVVAGYAQNQMIEEAKDMFLRMPIRDTISWTTMISGFVQSGQSNDALDLFAEFHRLGTISNHSTFTSALAACASIGAIEMGRQIHSLTIKTNCQCNTYVGTRLISMYAKCNNKEDVGQGFSKRKVRNVEQRNEALNLFAEFHRLGTIPTPSTFTSALVACADIGAIEIGRQIHSLTIKTNCQYNAYVGSGLISMYAKCNIEEDVSQVVSKGNVRNIEFWNSPFAGHSENSMLDDARNTFERMPKEDIVSWTAIISAYVQARRGDTGFELFLDMLTRGLKPNQMTLTSILSACGSLGSTKLGEQIHSLIFKLGLDLCLSICNALVMMYFRCCGDIGFELFLDMLTRGLKPNQMTLTSLLSACGSMGLTKLGEQIHGLIFKLGLDLCLYVCRAQVNMYFQCGSLDGLRVFREMPDRDLDLWNAVLRGCAQNGLGEEAVKIFEHMKAEGFVPNEVSFSDVLCACSHAGLVDKGWEYLNSMSQNYGITPLVNHYNFMVDLLGRAGKLSEAEALIENMPVQPNTMTWEALLAACRIHRDLKLGQRVAEKLFQMGTQSSGHYVLLSNIYASQGLWDKVLEIRRLMKNRGLKKEPGFSWIQIKNKLHCFSVGDKRHEHIGHIYSALTDLYGRLRAAGYEPNTNFVLHDVDEEQKQNELLYHSGRLAVAYGILSTPDGTPLQIMKNLRTCGDCHSFMKFVSKATQRKIVIRDGYRYHHIRDGACSCGDYW